MPAAMTKLEFEGKLLQRGFWLYVWRIQGNDGNEYLYVGMTGDTGSSNAQSPFNRVSQHLGSNINNSTLRRHLEDDKQLNPESCPHYSLHAYGPIFAEADNAAAHRERRAKISALEKKLRDALSVKYNVLNEVHSRIPLDNVLWKQVRTHFAKHFPGIAK